MSRLLRKKLDKKLNKSIIKSNGQIKLSDFCTQHKHTNNILSFVYYCLLAFLASLSSCFLNFFNFLSIAF